MSRLVLILELKLADTRYSKGGAVVLGARLRSVVGSSVEIATKAIGGGHVVVGW